MMKLSPKMLEVMDQLRGAAIYYLDGKKIANGEQYQKTCEYVYTAERTTTCWQKVHRVAGNLLLMRENTSTLKALEKRGLVEIVELGGRDFDIVRLVDDPNPPVPVERLAKMYVHTSYTTRYGDFIEHKTTRYAHVGIDYLAAAQREHEGKQTVEAVEILEEIPAVVWEPLALSK